MLNDNQIKKLIKNGFETRYYPSFLISSVFTEEGFEILLNGEIVFRKSHGLLDSNFNTWCNNYLKDNIEEYNKASSMSRYHPDLNFDDFIDFIIKVKNKIEEPTTLVNNKPESLDALSYALEITRMSWD